MKKIAFALLFIVSMSITGCANFSTLAVTNDMASLKGTSKEAILQNYGEPSEKADNGNTWDYRKPSDNSHNRTMSIGTLGLCGQKCLPYVDITRLKFKGNKVVSVEFIKETLNVTSSQMSILSGLLKDDKNKALLDQAPPEVKAAVKKQQVEQEPEVEDPPPATTKAKAKESATIKDSKKFTSCTLKKAKEQLCAHAKKLGMEVQGKGGKVSFITPDGEKITTTFKQVKKDVVVELASEDSGAAHDIKAILR